MWVDVKDLIIASHDNNKEKLTKKMRTNGRIIVPCVIVRLFSRQEKIIWVKKYAENKTGCTGRAVEHF